ncbi:JmjC domain-containing protein [Skeletonema marinoi]|uniref:JmjC domain-containing protein n=1 Tax=Skeletonema marinoi TaxID=267567 RepID=A0AAD8Y0G6_9STRA|nr:JmjC domain-containing protein [Skeletonema marinoi]
MDTPVDQTDGESCCSSSLPTHSLHMRAALNDCSELVERLRLLLHLNSIDPSCAQEVSEQLSMNNNHCIIQQLFHSAWVASGNIDQERELGLQSLHEISELDILHVDKSGWHRDGNKASSIPLTSSDFKREYCFRNVPCIIRGFDELHFKDVSLNWRKTDTTSTDDATTHNESRINTSWFERYVGEDTMVPVRIDGKNELDDDGRAEECETIMMSLKDWVSNCQQQSNNREGKVSRGYLKDWHLVQFLKSTQSDAPPLYKSPEYFERDLLNNFLEKYSDGGDYKFVYWGPRGSITRLHSDVLHSFSWSYNVTGSKKWTFYIPNIKSDSETTSDNDTCRSFEVIQNTGETIFVSSKIKHEVVNLVETLSINHNWITSDNIDNTWQCICSEIDAIEGEIKEWEVIPEDDFEARENMLRGCIGLDVTTFLLMILLEASELLVQVFSTIDAMTEKHNDNEIHDSALSICSLVKVLGKVLTCKEAKTAQRLQAIMGSKTRANQANELATFVLCLSDVLKEPLSS